MARPNQWRNKKNRPGGGKGGGRGGGRGGGHRRNRQGFTPHGSGKKTVSHPRSFYKDGVNIREVAAGFPELENYIIQDAAGNVRIDYKDNKSLNVLTKALAKRDFNLNLDLPLNMTPVLQMRYEYLLWIEDLLDKWPEESKSPVVNGIDIGAGASCLYALVAAKKNNWKMLTSEYDDQMFNCAERNIRSNDLGELVTLKKVNDKTFLEGLVDPDVPYYDFCMFSPPFLRRKDALISMGKQRNGNFLPLDGLKGRAAESMGPGGEVDLLMNIVKESEQLKCKIKVFSFIAGRNSTIDKIGPILVGLVGDKCVGTQVVCYGPNHSYAIAWTFDDNVKLKNENRLKFHERPYKKAVQLTFNNTSLDYAISYIIELLDEFMVNYCVVEKTENHYCIDINSYYSFWSKNGKEKSKNWKDRFINDEPAVKRRKLEGEQTGSIPPPTLAICPPKIDENEPGCSSNKLGDSVNAAMPSTMKQATTFSNRIPDVNTSKTYHSGDTLLVSAKLNIIMVTNQDVSIEILPTGGKTGLNGAHLISGFLKAEWRN